MNSLLLGRFFTVIAFMVLWVSSQLSSQPYRYWVDTTMPEQIVPTNIGSNSFPIGIYFYHYNHNYPATDIWTFLDSVNADHAPYFAENFTDHVRQQDRWLRYTDLLTSAPSGLRLLPIPAWNVSVQRQIDKCREVTFYPFDSSQLGGIALTGMEFFVEGHGYEENVFTSFDYDTTVINDDHDVDENYDVRGRQPRREAHYTTDMANETIASGIAFWFEDGQTERWPLTWNGSSWDTTGNPIRRSTYFDGAEYDGKHEFRSPHFLVVTGRLFANSANLPTTPLLRIDVYYEVSYGETYIDSTDTLRTADTNLRFLYKSIEWTKSDLFPVTGPPYDWNAHRIIAKRIDFEKEGMGGPAADGVTARGIDLEVVYLGEEKVALHSVAIRDSISHSMLREDATGDAFRTAFRKQIDSLLLVTAGTTYPKTAPNGIQNLYITDEPGPFAALALRRAKQEVENNYVFADGDTLTTGNGWALPHLQWNGGMNWTANGSYYTHYTGRLGEKAGLTFRGDTLVTIPSEKHHNGGRLTVPELFNIDSLDDADYVATMPGRIDTLNQIVQYARLGAALPEEKGDEFFWLVESLHESATWSRLSGTRHRSFVGPVNAFQITVDSSLVSSDTTINGNDTIIDNTYSYGRDTLLEHRPERSETRLLVSLSVAYGAKHLSYYTFESPPWAFIAHQDSLPYKPFTEIGICGLGIDDRFTNVTDWKLLDPNLGNAVPDSGSGGEPLGTVTYDSMGVITDLYVGWWDTYREIRQANAWVRRVAPTLVDLLWRDAYSMHFAVDAPYTTHDDSRTKRPLPSDEIISSVHSWHPITNALDSAWGTFVELGFFETKRTLDSNGVVDPLKDSNFVVVVNRRTLETGNYDQNDIGYSEAIKAVLDTLSETRTIRLRFNLGHPNSTQYSFIRVREVEPDTAVALPLIGIRRGLDTIVRGDSAVEITLGAGRAALLEVTYAKPDESIIDGHLHWNNQRKMVYFDDDRYHATYLRNDSVLYRRSMLMGANPASILWEPVETVVSIDPYRTTTQNWPPSITGSVHNGDTVITIVWTCHSDSAGVRDVVLHDLLINGGSQPVRMTIRHIDYHTGSDSTEIGDAVVSAMHGGDAIAWGDSALGIASRVRLRATPWSPTILSNRALVSQPYHQNGFVGRWPSLPTFAHRASVDSNVGIAWNQPNSFVNNDIHYRRVVQDPIVGTVPGISIVNHALVTASSGLHGRPSIDQTQDVWHRVQEGIAWSEYACPTVCKDILRYRSMWTETRARPGWDSIEATIPWSATATGIYNLSLPTIGSLNEVFVLADTLKAAQFSIAAGIGPGWTNAGDLYQSLMRYADNTFVYTLPKRYAYEGDHPQGSSSTATQSDRHAVLYETTLPSKVDVLRTTRQFFGAKARPTGYVAPGREVHIPVDDSTGTHYRLLMYDPWMADDASGSSIGFVGRDRTEQTDSIVQVESLLRTGYFDAGDSTKIGLELSARFYGDSTLGAGSRISLIAELVDSASGMVIEQLDSISVSPDVDSQYVKLEPEYDLLSATYFIRLRLDTAALSVETRPGDSRYPVVEYAGYVPSPPAAKFARRLGPTTGSNLRISAQPNPFDERTEIRFSIPEPEEVSIVVIDDVGREALRLVEGAEYRAGRWAVEFRPGQLPAGSYIVELRAGRERAIERVIVR